MNFRLFTWRLFYFYKSWEKEFLKLGNQDQVIILKKL